METKMPGGIPGIWVFQVKAFYQLQPWLVPQLRHL